MAMKNDGQMVESFQLMSINGDTFSLADLKGEKVYVKFWASWCSICLGGLDELDKLSTMDNDYKVITIVSPDYNGEKSEADFKEWFAARGHENLEVLLDVDGQISRTFGVRGYPTSAFIGSDGVLVYLYPGHIDNQLITDTFSDIY
jgi:peptide methionine sulfoxide reductase msrA/msrB